ncbi:uncharacterized protein [Drosophila virilis]|uniref:Uncharacterized protein n=1 Tax=Drosophila virilis TaxID=7244 RepID=B4M350_DROVI|nr:uncharacterized protein LOC6631300 [Drosophila virilis]EDW65225.1 uncharacterized protein Dvir_GJ19147 [Drosophila virilis]
MKADQINRLMRVNGRKNLWLLRNTNQLYENAVKSYYERSTSLLPYSPMSQNVKVREENRAPLRILTMQRERSTAPEYPRNHKQMADQAACANSGHLLNTVIQANRRRSMSFSAGGLRMYGKQILNDNGGEGKDSSRPDKSSTNVVSGSNLKGKQQRTDGCVNGNNMDLGGFSGRSMSLPPRTTLELGVGYALGKGKGPPSCKHHFIAIEKTANAGAASLTKRQRRDYDNDADKLMVVDEALKQRLAVRFDRQPEDEPSTARFRLGFGSAGLIDGRQLPGLPKSYTMRGEQATPHNVIKEQTRFQTLGERIRQFEVIQFADGPVAYQAFNRRQGYASGRIQQIGNKHLPKQEPCLSFHNVLHTNHRQRSFNFQTRSQSLESNSEPVSRQKEPLAATQVTNTTGKRIKPPLGPLGPLAPNWRPQQQQQQQHEHKLDALLRPVSIVPTPPSARTKTKLKQCKTPVKIRKTKSKRSVKQTGSIISSSSSCSSSTSSSSSSSPKQANSKTTNAEAMEIVQSKVIVPDEAKTKDAYVEESNQKSNSHADNNAHKAALSNNISRTSHLFYMKSNSRRQEVPAPRLAEQLQAVKKMRVTRKLPVELPKQPQSVKGAHHLLAASASQVSAYKRAYKNRQQILQAEMLHIHAQRLPEQHQQRQQRFQRQQQQCIAQDQPLNKPSGYFPTAAKKYSISQLKADTKTLAKHPAKSAPTKKTSVQQQQQQQQLQPPVKLEPPKRKVRQQPEARKLTTPQTAAQAPPRPSYQQSVSVLAPFDPKQRRKTVPHLAYAYKSAGHVAAVGHVAAAEQSFGAGYKRLQQQQQLHQQLRQRRQQPLESLWRRNY